MTLKERIQLEKDVATVQPCSCEPAWRDRDMVDAHCWYHQAVETVEILRERGWTVVRGEEGQ